MQSGHQTTKNKQEAKLSLG